ncbi:hypothetical protein CONPUDRAFT_160987 [Coniophora puteana RWD-64-598 SS2]|uniref:Uncharacterized protein n=1 Tax=Coniophora puteana (strain RWD-64-598) TaxID=741705 RepID=A0A5M3N449_CONPW|nr:uncharacterized protein CONPUDRAFT_160987 [Coniophora puteana RWD-64-598 SS2]EIW86163.1 hypothetical protein CONPUDRAFT_160987 [Coniophora puteana RWD-64-598 SS2]
MLPVPDSCTSNPPDPLQINAADPLATAIGLELIGALTVGGTFYGFMAAAAALCVRALVQTRARWTPRRFAVLLASVCALWAVGTVLVASEARSTIEMAAFSMNSGPRQGREAPPTDATTVVVTSSYYLMNVLVDGIMVRGGLLAVPERFKNTLVDMALQSPLVQLPVLPHPLLRRRCALRVDDWQVNLHPTKYKHIAVAKLTCVVHHPAVGFVVAAVFNVTHRSLWADSEVVEWMLTTQILITLTFNIYTTLLMACRLLLYRRRFKHNWGMSHIPSTPTHRPSPSSRNLKTNLTSHHHAVLTLYHTHAHTGSPHKSHYTSMGSMLVESCTAVTIFTLLFLATYLVHSPAAAGADHRAAARHDTRLPRHRVGAHHPAGSRERNR